MSILANALIKVGLEPKKNKDSNQPIKERPKTFSSQPQFQYTIIGVIDFKTKRIKDYFKSFKLKNDKKNQWGKGMILPNGKDTKCKITVIGKKNIVDKINSRSTVRARAVLVKKTWVENSIFHEETNLDLRLVGIDAPITSEIKFLARLDSEKETQKVLARRKQEGYINKKLIQGGYVSYRTTN